jgi:hypothetical protein
MEIIGLKNVLKILNHMKSIKPFLTIIVIFLICSFWFSECSVSRTTALPCPQALTKENNEVSAKHKRKRIGNTTFTPKYTSTIRRQPVKHLISLSRKNQVKNTDALNNSPIHKNVITAGPEYLNGLSKIGYYKSSTASIDEKVIPLRKNYLSNFQVEKSETRTQQTNVIIIPRDRCDTIIFKSGYRVIGKVLEIGQNNLTYRKSGDLKGPEYSILNSDVLEIRTYNGKQIFVTSSDTNSYRTDDIEKTMGLGLAGFFISLIGIILGAILCKEYILAAIIIAILTGVAGIFSGIISLIKNRHSNDFKEKLFAILSISLGGFEFIVVLGYAVAMGFIFLLIYLVSN